MNKLAAVGLLFALVACQQEPSQPKRSPRVVEPSALAATMREMTADMESLKAKAQAGTLTHRRGEGTGLNYTRAALRLRRLLLAGH